ncbi:sulfatase [Seonamhaeicola maritimus]|uniref:sulfatase n=1 Tax=Seonamhaeicola maritimus TaxID=2591822 RepID=UPI0024957E0F|nr:sulfatase [Seonamhaeicola maritimus]
MKVKCFLVIFCLSLMSFGQTKPNILIIHVDDLGYYDLGFNGSVLHNTLAIDKLASESVAFKNAYANYPRCTPSRYGMMTATYPVNENKGYLGGIPDSKNFIKQFNKEGYDTSYIGKWHLGEGDSSPKSFGFKHSYAAGRAGGIGSRFYPFNFNKRNGKRHKEQVEDLEKDGEEGDYASDMLTDATISFIKNNPKDQPFLAVLAYYSVHTPIEAKPEDEERNKKQLETISFNEGPEYIKEGAGRRKMRQDHPGYAGMVENIDENIDRLLKTLEDLEIDENTIVVLSSDHGALSNDGHKGYRELASTNLPLRAGKGWMYEGGIRVPLFVKWAKELKPRIDSKSIVMGMDVFPTLLELTTGKQLDGLDGKSYANVLKGKETWQDRIVYWHKRKARPHSTGDYNSSAIRSGDFKLVHFYENDKIELYNLKEDVGETKDLSEVNFNKTKELLDQLNKWKSEYLIPEKMNLFPPKRKGKK